MAPNSPLIDSPSGLRLAVCQTPPELVPGSSEWRRLCDAVAAERPDLLLLSELPFGPWIAAGETFDERLWKKSCAIHDDGLGRLAEFGARAVAGTRPREVAARRVNEAFVWTQDTGAQAVHTKQHFPDEAGYFETRWFDTGLQRDGLAVCGGVRAAFLICTELMFNEHARQRARAGAQLLLVPRAVGVQSLGRWQVAARMAAIVSGSYVGSSNRGGTDSSGQQFGGCGWIVDPWGDVVAQTTLRTPVVAHQIDLQWVARAHTEFPCYAAERRP